MNRNQIATLQKYFANKPVLKAYLFGSNVRNDMSSKSDIDLLVELDYSQVIGIGFIKMKLELQKLLATEVDLISDNAVSKYIRPYIDKEKQLIYER